MGQLDSKGAVAIITARGGSKRIPRKNIRTFLGAPIIGYSIEAALGAQCFEEVMVSTEDEEIAGLARSLGAKVPFMRSPQMANDIAGTAEVLDEVIREYGKRDRNFSFLCGIYPTAPFITSVKLQKCMSLLRGSDADAVLPVVRFSYPVQRALKIEDGTVKMIWPENYSMRSQDLSPTYHDAGQFYCLRTESLLEQGRLFPEKTLPFELPESEVQDIDSEEDWKIAEIKYRAHIERQ
jgi:pseudaminic acid cytidylyltransferase